MMFGTVPEWGLLADAKPGDDFAVAIGVGLLEVIEEAAALGDQHEEAAAGAVVLGVGLEVLGQLADALGEDRDLDLWAAGVRVMRAKFLNDVGFLCGFQHRGGAPNSSNSLGSVLPRI